MNNVLPTIPDGWRHSHLEDLAFLDREKLSEGTNGSFSFYYIDISAVSEGNLQLPATKISFRGSPSRARKVVRRGDVLMASVRPNLKAFAYFDHTNDDCIASTGFAVLTAKPNVDPRFILASILSNSVTAQIESHVVGSNYPAINSKDIRRLEILAPPPAQQRKIARILTKVDNLIEKTEALIAKYQAIKQGMMHDLFTRGVDEHGHLRPPYEQAPELYKQSELGWIPRDWEVVPLNRTYSQIKRGPSLSTNLQGKGIRYLTSDNIIPDGRLDWTTKKHLDVLPTFLKSILEVGDVLLNCVNSEEQIGKTGFVDSLPEQTTVGFNSFAITFRKGDVIPRYAYYQISDSRFQLMLRQMVKPAINQASFSSTDIMEMPLASPSIVEQEQIVSRLDAITSSIISEHQPLQKFQQLKTGLMQDLLTGKVRVKVEEAEEVSHV